MHAGPFRCRAQDGELQPFETSVFKAALEGFGARVVYVELADEKRTRSNQQNKYWWSVVVPTIAQCWQHDKGWSVPPAKSVVHGALIRAVFGTVETPLGPERRSSTDLTTQEFTDLIEWTREYARDKYRVEIPLPGEGV